MSHAHAPKCCSCAGSNVVVRTESASELGISPRTVLMILRRHDVLCLRT